MRRSCSTKGEPRKEQIGRSDSASRLAASAQPTMSVHTKTWTFRVRRNSEPAAMSKGLFVGVSATVGVGNSELTKVGVPEIRFSFCGSGTFMPSSTDARCSCGRKTTTATQDY